MRTNEETYNAFINGKLSKGEWTHEAHLVTGWMALQKMSATDALSHLRDSIKAHNCGIGIQNTDHSGYHETLTVYYVTAIAATDAASPDELFDDPTLSSTAPLTFWNKDTLMSVEARLGWMAPDREALPWDPVGQAPSSRI